MSRATIGLVWGTFCFALTASSVFAQGETPSAAESLHSVVSPRGAEWSAEFLSAFLGVNHESSQPEISKVFQQIVRARSASEARAVTEGFGGDRALLESVLDLALQESRVWEPGRVLRQETLNTLSDRLYREPPPKGRQHRLESYSVPEPLAAWLFEEQVVNSKVMSEVNKVDVALGDLPRELDPMRQPQYWLGHVEIPLEEARVLRGGSLDPRIADQLLVERGGKTFVRYFVHPGSTSSPSMRRIIEKYGGLKFEHLAMPTASPRSLAVWNPYASKPFMLLKVSLTRQQGDIFRINTIGDGMRAVAATRAFDMGQGGADGPSAFLREPVVIFPGDSNFGMVVREPKPGFPASSGGHFVPGTSLMSQRPGGGRPLLVKMIEESGRPPLAYVREMILRPFLTQYADAAYRQGLVGDPHQQNVLLEVGADGQLTGRILIRDMECHRIDAELRLRQGLSSRGLLGSSRSSAVGELSLQAARSYYDYSYKTYVYDDWGYMLGRLSLYFPELSPGEITEEMNRILAGEIRKHLGVDLKPGRRALRPNEAVAEFRRRMADVDPVALPPGITSEVLKEEFLRLRFNQRVLWLGPKTRVDRTSAFVLHEGVIEFRNEGRPVALAFLESPGTSSYYEGRKGPHRDPDPQRLSLLYGQRSPGAFPARTGKQKQTVMSAVLFDGDEVRRAPGEKPTGFSGPVEPVPPKDPAAVRLERENLMGLEGDFVPTGNRKRQSEVAAARSSTREIVRAEAKGMAEFTAALVLKEGVQGMLENDPGRWSTALQQTLNVRTAASLVSFTAASRVTDRALSSAPASRLLARVSPRILPVLRAGLPMAVGMNLVNAIEGHRDLEQVAVTTGSMMVAGNAMELMAGPLQVAAARFHPTARTLVHVAKLATVLYAAEKMEHGYRAMVHRPRSRVVPGAPEEQR